MRQVPPWAIRLVIDREDLESEQTGGLHSDYRFIWEEEQK